jgi:hypothetical protein
VLARKGEECWQRKPQEVEHSIPHGQGNDLGYGKNEGDMVMGNLQPSPYSLLKLFLAEEGWMQFTD